MEAAMPGLGNANLVDPPIEGQSRPNAK